MDLLVTIDVLVEYGFWLLVDFISGFALRCGFSGRFVSWVVVV